jgi:hypothetical protein
MATFADLARTLARVCWDGGSLDRGELQETLVCTACSSRSKPPSPVEMNASARNSRAEMAPSDGDIPHLDAAPLEL